MAHQSPNFTNSIIEEIVKISEILDNKDLAIYEDNLSHPS